MNDDRLRSELDRAAARVELGDAAAMLDSAHGAVRRRRLVRRVTAVGAAVAVLAAGAVVVLAARGDDAPTALVAVDPTTTVAPTTSEATSTTSPSSTSIAPDASVVPETTVVAGDGGSTASVATAPGMPYPEIGVPWRDGFLVAGTLPMPRPLPDELPEEIRELFPPEVLELFPDGLPDTLEEAQQTLTDAGLLDVVIDILAEHPEANDAVYAEPLPPPTSVARFTTDGENWEDIELDLPDEIAWVQAAESDGERLVVVGAAMVGPVRTSTVVATTSDLTSWSVAEVPAASASENLPEFINWYRQPVALAVSADRWVARFAEHVEVDPMQMPGIDPSLAADGYGMSVDDVGVTFDFLVDGSAETVSVAWDDLGLAPELVEDLVAASSYGQRTRTASAEFGQQMVLGEPETGPRFDSPIVSTSAGFIDVGMPTRFSADGVTWEERERFSDEAYPVGTIVAGDGAVAFLAGNDGVVRAWRIDARGEVLGEVDIPGLPDRFVSYHGGFSSAVGADGAIVVDVGGATVYVPEPFVTSADGYVLTIPVEPEANWVITDEATGEVVLEGRLDDTPFDDEVVRFDENGITIIDPATGEELVTFPHEVDEPTADEYVEYPSELVLVATADGQTFTVDPLSTAQGDVLPSLVITNGGDSLVSMNGTWQLYDLG